MSPTRSSAGGLKARTRATRFAGSSSRTPGVAANTRPLASYVPSPGSNSSATAISSPGRTILRSVGITSTLGFARKTSRRIYPFATSTRNSTTSMRRASSRWNSKVCGIGNEYGKRSVIVAPAVSRYCRTNASAGLCPERRVHEDGVERFADVGDVVVPPLGFDADCRGVLLRHPNRRRIRIHADDARGAEQLRPNPKSAIPASEVEAGAPLDIPAAVGAVDDLGGDRRRRRIRLSLRSRLRHRSEGLEDALELDFLHWLPSAEALTRRTSPTAPGPPACPEA